MGKRRAPSGPTQNGAKSPTVDTAPSKKEKSSCGDMVQNTIVGGLEKVFFKYGQFVAKHPIPVVVGSLIFAGLCGIRLGFEWASETDQTDLWVPKNSDFYRNQKWLTDNFPSSFRLSSIIIKAMVDGAAF